MSFDKTNTFTLGKGDKDKPENSDQDTSKWPDYKGIININGTEYYLAAWIKENGTTGEKFFSGAVKPKEQQAQTATQPAPTESDDFRDDDMPF